MSEINHSNGYKYIDNLIEKRNTLQSIYNQSIDIFEKRMLETQIWELNYEIGKYPDY